MRHTAIFLHFALALRTDFTSNLVHELAFGAPKFYILPYGKTMDLLNFDVKSDLRADIETKKLNETVSRFSHCQPTDNVR